MAWTKQEKDFLINNNNKISVEEMCKILGKSRNVVYNMRHRLGLGKYKWSEEDIRTLKSLYTKHNSKEIAKKLHRTDEEVKIQIKRLDLNCDIWTYTTVEIADLLGTRRTNVKYYHEAGHLKFRNNGDSGKGKNVSNTIEIKEFMEKHQDLWCAVKGYKALELFKDKPKWLQEKIEKDKSTGGRKNNRHWSDEEDKKLQELYEGMEYMSTSEISEIMGRSERSIKQRCNVLFLNRFYTERKSRNNY